MIGFLKQIENRWGWLETLPRLWPLDPSTSLQKPQQRENPPALGLPVKQMPLLLFLTAREMRRQRSKAQKKRRETAQLAFINTTDSGQPVPGAQELIRTHVMSDYWRKKALKKGQNLGRKATRPELSSSASEVMPLFDPICLQPQPLGGPDPFSRFPVEMKPFMFSLMQRCELCPVIYR